MLKTNRFNRRRALPAALLITGLLLIGLPKNAPAAAAENDSDSLSQLQALVASLNTHVTNLELNSVTLQQQIGYLQAANQNLEDEIKTLKAANRQLQQDLQQQEERYVGLENVSRDLQAQVGDLRRLQNEAVIGLQKQVDRCQEQVNSCYSQVNSLQNELATRRRSQ